MKQIIFLINFICVSEAFSMNGHGRGARNPAANNHRKGFLKEVKERLEEARERKEINEEKAQQWERKYLSVQKLAEISKGRKEAHQWAANECESKDWENNQWAAHSWAMHNWGVRQWKAREIAACQVMQYARQQSEACLGDALDWATEEKILREQIIQEETIQKWVTRRGKS